VKSDGDRYALKGASMFAPETLVGVRKRASGFLFLGESGATYASKGPLDDFTAVHAAPEPMRSVAFGRDAIVAITQRDTLVRSTDDGVSFSAIATFKTAATPVALTGSA